MSRSYKKHPIAKDNNVGASRAKTHANRVFRRCISNRELHTGKSAFYRRYSESWNIHDYICRWTKAEAEAEWEQEELLLKNGMNKAGYRINWHHKFKTKERYMNYWAKCMRRK